MNLVPRLFPAQSKASLGDDLQGPDSLGDGHFFDRKIGLNIVAKPPSRSPTNTTQNAEKKDSTRGCTSRRGQAHER